MPEQRIKDRIIELIEKGNKPYRIVRVIYGDTPTKGQEQHVYKVAQFYNMKKERDELLKGRK